jgi:hypothetical protein
MAQPFSRSIVFEAKLILPAGLVIHEKNIHTSMSGTFSNHPGSHAVYPVRINLY